MKGGQVLQENVRFISTSAPNAYYPDFYLVKTFPAPYICVAEKRTFSCNTNFKHDRL
jgi:hypothetical protein